MLIDCAHSLLSRISPEVMNEFQVLRRVTGILSVFWSLLFVLLLISLLLKNLIVLSYDLRLKPATGYWLLTVRNVYSEFNIWLDKNLYRFLFERFLCNCFCILFESILMILHSLLRACTFSLELLLVLVLIILVINLQAWNWRLSYRILLFHWGLDADLLIIISLHFFALLICSEEILNWDIVLGRNFDWLSIHRGELLHWLPVLLLLAR